MSRNTLKGIEPQTCLDDLESFYYVLLYIATIHMDTKFSRRGLPSPLTLWDGPRAFASKTDFILSRFAEVTDPRLGKPFQKLAERLHSVFRKIMVQAFIADGRDEPPPVVNHEEIYDMMLSHVRDAIDDLDRETQDGITTPSQLIHKEKNANTLEDDSSSSAPRRLKSRARKKTVRTLAANRTRRHRPRSPETDPVRIHQVILLYP